LTSGARIGKLEPSALDAELAALREGRHAELAGPESVVARTAAALVARGDLDDAEYEDERKSLSQNESESITMKLVTFDAGRVGRLEGEGDA
jgi:hypothetical protein